MLVRMQGDHQGSECNPCSFIPYIIKLIRSQLLTGDGLPFIFYLKTVTLEVAFSKEYLMNKGAFMAEKYWYLYIPEDKHIFQNVFISISITVILVVFHLLIFKAKTVRPSLYHFFIFCGEFYLRSHVICSLMYRF